MNHQNQLEKWQMGPSSLQVLVVLEDVLLVKVEEGEI
jgi:hypothetical protein